MAGARGIGLAILVGVGVTGATADAYAARGPCIPGTATPKCHIWKGKLGPVDDGDTVKVDIRGDRSRRHATVRLTGVQAMELTRYGRKRGRRGECHGVAAAERLDDLFRQGRRRVRLAAQKKGSSTGRRARLRRHVSTKIRGRWVDVGAVLLEEGLALWFANPVEWAWNGRYSRIAERAAARNIGIWNERACGSGPSQSIPLSLKVKWDAQGNDSRNINGEWVRITNTDPLSGVSLRGWWFRDSHLRRYRFPDTAVVPPRGSIRLHVGDGTAGGNRLFWRLKESVFENATSDRRQIGDGGYLFDPQGDLRAYAQYPCRTGCSDPLAGKVTVSASYRTPERVTIRNVSGEVLDLSEYEIENSPWFYEFERDTRLLPRTSVTLYTQRAPVAVGGPLMRSWGHGDSILADSGDVVTLRNPLGGPVACHAWGGWRCPSV